MRAPSRRRPTRSRRSMPTPRQARRAGQALGVDAERDARGPAPLELANELIRSAPQGRAAPGAANAESSRHRRRRFAPDRFESDPATASPSLTRNQSVGSSSGAACFCSHQRSNGCGDAPRDPRTPRSARRGTTGRPHPRSLDRQAVRARGSGDRLRQSIACRRSGGRRHNRAPRRARPPRVLVEREVSRALRYLRARPSPRSTTSRRGHATSNPAQRSRRRSPMAPWRSNQPTATGFPWSSNSHESC